MDCRVTATTQPHYQTVVDCTYWPVLVLLNNWNIINFTNIIKSSEDFDEVHQVVLDGISDTMYSLVQIGKHGDINAEDTTKLVHNVVK